jgi:hypothetical protein
LRSMTIVIELPLGVIKAKKYTIFHSEPPGRATPEAGSAA